MQDILDKDAELIYHLLNKEQGEKTMGNIRAKGKCRECGTAFTEIKKIGFICKKCKTLPPRLYIDLNHKGKRIRVFSDRQGMAIDTYQRARNLLGHINYEIKNNCFDSSNYVKAELEKFWICKLIDEYVDTKINDLAPSYQKNFLKMLSVAKDHFKTKDCREIKKTDLKDYKKYLEQNFKLGNKSIKNYIDLFRTFLFYLRDDDSVLDLNVPIMIPPLPDIDIPESDIKTLSAGEQVKVMDLIPKEHQPLIAFLMLHGCRVGEARSLRCKDIDLNNGSIRIGNTFSNGIYREKRKGKRARAVTIPLHNEIKDFVAERIKGNHPEAYVFVNPATGQHYKETYLKNLWQAVRKEAGLGDMKLKDATRHSLGTILTNELGVSSYIASKFLGHSSSKTTEKYYLHSNIKSLKVNSDKLSLGRIVNIKVSPDCHQQKNNKKKEQGNQAVNE